MKVSVNVVFLSLFAASLVSGAPIGMKQQAEKSNEGGMIVQMDEKPGDAKPKAAAGNSTDTNNDDNKDSSKNETVSNNKAGAFYFITNEEDDNFVVSGDILDDGKVLLRQAISTGGVGIRGDDQNKNNPAPLFSQGAVAVSQATKLLATVNSGSNTLSLFKIDEQDPALLSKIGSTVGSGGEFPVSVTFNSKGDKLCALNGGEVNGVSCFKVDKNNGLSPLAGTNRPLKLKQTTPATGAPGSASHLLFSEDDKQLFASIKGIPDAKVNNGRGTVGVVLTFDVANDGSLSKDFKVAVPPAQGLAPFGMALVPGKKAVVVADPAVGFDVIDLESANNANADSKSVAVAVDKQTANGWTSFSKKTNNFYLTDAGNGRVTEVKVDDNLKGTVVSQTDLGNNSGAIDNAIATVKGKDFLYVLSAKASAIDVLSLDAPGKVTKVQTHDIGEPAKKVNLKLDPIKIQGLATFITA